MHGEWVREAWRILVRPEGGGRLEHRRDGLSAALRVPALLRAREERHPRTDPPRGGSGSLFFFLKGGGRWNWARGLVGLVGLGSSSVAVEFALVGLGTALLPNFRGTDAVASNECPGVLNMGSSSGT